MSKFIKINLLLFLLVLFLVLTKVSKQNAQTEIPTDEITKTVEKLNNRNFKIKSITCKEVGFKKIKSKLIYQKPDCFLLVVENFSGPQFEVGFNKLDFWFWIKDFDPKNTYHCDVSKVIKTRTKPILYPEVLVDLIGINEIDIKKFKFYSKNNKIIAIEQKCGLDHIVVLDQEKIIEQSFYQNGELILKIESKNFTDYDGTKIPKKLILNFYQEGFYLPLEIDPVDVNKEIEIKMPIDKAMINLEDL